MCYHMLPSHQQEEMENNESSDTVEATPSDTDQVSLPHGNPDSPTDGTAYPDLHDLPPPIIDPITGTVVLTLLEMPAPPHPPTPPPIPPRTYKPMLITHPEEDEEQLDR
ncbi:hypothetical protein MRV_0006 [Murine roseolovirus]|uniref:Uncharacterized protein n=1 Tax=Murid betaherpesvirus 3 TaxID=2560603 RepID=A0A1P8VIR1_9BETA|nr:hypothetical protein MRV_0006 [Murine roseolovirus]APZ76217.1 hypothetical protein MRV_0006 [Murid betaherpesvirus 3]